MRIAILGSALVAGLTLTACKSLNVEDFNASALGDLTEQPHSYEHQHRGDRSAGNQPAH